MMVNNRFWAKVNKDGPVPDYRPELGPCWFWTGAQTSDGYGQFWLGRKLVSAHRFAYELLVGPIPSGLTIDHLCRNHHCVNTDHLEPVTNEENVLRGNGYMACNARKTHCPQGHPYDAENTHRNRRGGRRCRECNREYSREWRAKQKRERLTI